MDSCERQVVPLLRLFGYYNTVVESVWYCLSADNFRSWRDGRKSDIYMNNSNSLLLVSGCGVVQ